MIQNENQYLGQFVTGGLEEVGKNKTPRIFITYNVTHEAVNGDWQEVAEPVQRDVGFWFSDKAYDGTVKLLQEMGWNLSLTEPTFKAEVMENAVLVCKHEEYKEKLQERWNLKDYSTEFGKTMADEKTLRQLQARLESATKAADLEERF